MWRCSNCGTGIEDQYAHCWQCGAPNAVKRAQPARPQGAVPAFESYEELAKVPSRPTWFLRRGPLQKLAIFLVGAVVLKIADAFFNFVNAPFFRSYGLYIVIGVAVIALLIILWKFFRRDPGEGVGIKLN